MDANLVIGISAALLGLTLVVLSFRVVNVRRREKIGVGMGDCMPLTLAVRVHANFIEYVPMGLILIFLLERNGGSSLAAYLAATLVIARLLHAFGLSRSAGTSPGRFIGTSLTWAVLITASVGNIYILLK